MTIALLILATLSGWYSAWWLCRAWQRRRWELDYKAALKFANRGK